MVQTGMAVRCFCSRKIRLYHFLKQNWFNSADSSGDLFFQLVIQGSMKTMEKRALSCLNAEWEHSRELEGTGCWVDGLLDWKHETFIPLNTCGETSVSLAISGLNKGQKGAHQEFLK